jgi:hypothetical protein
MRASDENGNPLPFNITFVTCDVNRKTGGKLKTMKQAYMTVTERKRTADATKVNAKASQRHFSNATRNIKSVSGELNKLHIYLITRLNGIPVI